MYQEINNSNSNNSPNEIFKNDFEEKMYYYRKYKISFTQIIKSKNLQYKVLYGDGYLDLDKDVWVNGNLALINNDEIVFKTNPERPHYCFVSDNGIVICCDILNNNDLNGKFIIYDDNGNVYFSHITSANLKTSCICSNGLICIFLTMKSKTEDSEKVFVVDIEKRSFLGKFDIPVKFKKILINSDLKIITFVEHDDILFETDYVGNQLNLKSYENQIFLKGDIYDKLWYLINKNELERYSYNNFEDLINHGINDEKTLQFYEEAFLYTIRGEFYFYNNLIEKAQNDWEKAILLKPSKILKKKIENLLKK